MNKIYSKKNVHEPKFKAGYFFDTIVYGGINIETNENGFGQSIVDCLIWFIYLLL